MKQASTDTLTNLLKRVYFDCGLSPSAIDSLSAEELELLVDARDNGLVGYAEKTDFQGQSTEPRIVITSTGYIRMTWGANGLEEYKQACERMTRKSY